MHTYQVLEQTNAKVQEHNYFVLEPGPLVPTAVSIMIIMIVLLLHTILSYNILYSFSKVISM